MSLTGAQEPFQIFQRNQKTREFPAALLGVSARTIPFQLRWPSCCRNCCQNRIDEPRMTKHCIHFLVTRFWMNLHPVEQGMNEPVSMPTFVVTHPLLFTRAVSSCVRAPFADASLCWGALRVGGLNLMTSKRWNVQKWFNSN